MVELVETTDTKKAAPFGNGLFLYKIIKSCYNFFVPQVFIGEVIRETRIRLGYTQEDLCSGDLDITTISRIESGEHAPQNNVIKRIFAQMNMRIPINLVRVTDEEFKRYQLQSEIEAHIVDANTTLNAFIEDFKNCDIPMDEFDEQFYFYVKGLIQKRVGNYNNAVELFYKAIKFTIPNFSSDFDFTKKHSMLERELQILLELSEMPAALFDGDYAERYLLFLLKYTEHGIMNEHTRVVMHLQVLVQLSIKKETDGDYQKMLEYARMGTSFCIKKDSLYLLPELFYLEGTAYAYEKIEKSARKSLTMCFILLEHLGRSKELILKKNEIKQRFNLDVKW